MTSSASTQDFSVFLNSSAVSADGTTRKAASPSILSPSNGMPLPTLENRLKAKSRHVKTASQPLRLDTSELREEQARLNAQQQPRLASEDDGRTDFDRGIRSLATATTGSEDAEDSKKKGGYSISKRIAKMSLVRGVSGASSSGDKAASSPRPRSPSKESGMGSMLRRGNRSAIVTKLGLGGLYKRESDEKEGEETLHPNLETSPLSLANTPGSLITSPYSTMSSISQQQQTIPPAANIRRSSAPTNVAAVVDPSLLSPMPQSNMNNNNNNNNNGETSPKRRERRSSGIKLAASGRPAPVDVKEPSAFTTNDLSPLFLQEKNPSASTIQLGTDHSLPPIPQKRMDLETQRWREDHAAMELNMAKTVKGAMVIAKTARKRQSSLEGDNLRNSSDEAMRIAALTLQVNNDARLQKIVEKLADYEKLADGMKKEALRTQEDVRNRCRELFEAVGKHEALLAKERENFEQRDTIYKTRNGKVENELQSLNEKVSDAVRIKEKGFQDVLNDADTRLKKLIANAGGSGEQDWIMGLLDHFTHSLMELVLLGGGTILSIISFIVVYIKSWIPGYGSSSTKRSSSGRVHKKTMSAQNVNNIPSIGK